MHRLVYSDRAEWKHFFFGRLLVIKADVLCFIMRRYLKKVYNIFCTGYNKFCLDFLQSQIFSSQEIMRSYGACNQAHHVRRGTSSYSIKSILLFVVSALVVASSITIVAYWRHHRAQLLQSENQFPPVLQKVVDFKRKFSLLDPIIHLRANILRTLTSCSWLGRIRV